MEQARYRKPWEYALPQADARDSNAQCLISLLFLCGLGVAVDLDEAESWLRKAPAQDSPVVWSNLGTLLMLKGEPEKAKQCYQRVVALGFASTAGLAKK